MRISQFMVLGISAIILLFLNSCFKRSLSDDKDLQFGRSYLGEKLMSHFPLNDVNDTYSMLVDTVSFHTNTINMGLALFNSDADERIKKALNDYKSKKLYSDNDSCIVVLNDFLYEKDLLNILGVIYPNPNEYDPNLDYNKVYKSKIFKSCKDKYEVVPNFWNAFYAKGINTRSHLDRNFKFIIIDSQFSDTATWSPKLDPSKSYMPDPVRHGYSRGFAFNERERIIIYWVILW